MEGVEGLLVANRQTLMKIEEAAGQQGRTATSVGDTRTAGGERVDREGLRTEGN